MRFVAKRLGATALLLLVMSVVTFALTRLIPGNPARVAAGQYAPESEVSRMSHQLGLDEPLPIQYLRYLWRLLHLNLGVSYQTGRPVLADLERYVPATLELVILAMVCTLLAGVTLGAISAYHAGSKFDRVATLVASITAGAPVFWVGLLLQLTFFYHLGLLPNGGEVAPNVNPPNRTGFLLVDIVLTGQWGLLIPALEHLVLPVLTLTIANIGLIMRVTRQSFIREMGRPYALVARSKGLRTWQIMYHHLLRNALNPVVSVLGIQFGYTITGAVLVESIFSWPGIGKYTYDSVTNLDYPAILGVTLFVTFAFVIANLLVDLVHAWLDPRLRLQ